MTKQPNRSGMITSEQHPLKDFPSYMDFRSDVQPTSHALFREAKRHIMQGQEKISNQ